MNEIHHGKRYSKEFIAEMVRNLDAEAEAYQLVRAKLTAARMRLEIGYACLGVIHKYAVLQGLEVSPMPPPPVLYKPGVAALRKQARARRDAARAERPHFSSLQGGADAQP